MSDHRGIQDVDPAERLASALNRIAVASERREAIAAAAASTGMPAGQGPAPLPGVAADLDGLIVRLRAVLDGMPNPVEPLPTTSQEAPPGAAFGE